MTAGQNMEYVQDPESKHNGELSEGKIVKTEVFKSYL